MAPKRLVVIDGYSLLYRAFFATRYLSTSDGRPTNALHGFVNMMFYLLENIKPSAIVVALDAPGKTFRHADFAEYKGTRKETADELKVQLVAARDLIAALGIPSFEVPSYEADDIVGCISSLGEKNGYQTTIVTGDLDSLQLVDEHVSVLTLRQGVTDTVTYTPKEVEERYGFGPRFIPDYKALVGDTSDNIPGVPGIGAKGAAELIQNFGTIEEMIEKIAEIPSKFQKKLDGQQEQMRLSKKLATIICEVPISYDFEPFVLNQEEYAKAQTMLESYEMRSHLRRLPTVLGPYLDGAVEDRPAEVVAEKLEIQLAPASNLTELKGFVANRPYALVLGEAPPTDDLFTEPVRPAFVAVGDEVRETSEKIALELLAEMPRHSILHDAKPLYKKIGKKLPAPGFDTLLAGYVLQSARSTYELRDLVQGYLDVVPPATPAEMAAALFRLQKEMSERLYKEEQVRVFQELEQPLVPILAQMEKLGVAVDRNMLREFSKAVEVTLIQTGAKIYEMAGQEFNIGSPKQLGEILFEKLQIPGFARTKTGYATGAEILQQLAPEYPICSEVLSWRELSKLKSTYADALGGLIAQDGRIHTTYNMTVAATGRISSNDPNLQNIPIRTELGRGIRKAFHAAPGYQFASFDYSQIELRLLAHFCKDPNLIAAFESGEDVHTVTADLMFHTGGNPSKEQRRYAKMLNYAVLYGVTDWGLASQLGGGFSVVEAKALIEQYFDRFPSVKEFTSGVVAEARSKGFTTTLCGRRRYHPDIHAVKINERRAAERQAMNAPIQGSAADMLKLAMIHVFDLLCDARSRMILTVHDELVFEIAEGEESFLEPIRKAMENALPLSVPVVVDAKIGPNWDDMTIIG